VQHRNVLPGKTPVLGRGGLWVWPEGQEGGRNHNLGCRGNFAGSRQGKKKGLIIEGNVSRSLQKETAEHRSMVRSSKIRFQDEEDARKGGVFKRVYVGEEGPVMLRTGYAQKSNKRLALDEDPKRGRSVAGRKGEKKDRKKYPPKKPGPSLLS